MSILYDVGEVEAHIWTTHNEKIRKVLDKKVKKFGKFRKAIRGCRYCSRTNQPNVAPHTPADWNGIVILDGAPALGDAEKGSLLARPDRASKSFAIMLEDAGIDINRCYVTTALKCYSTMQAMSFHIEACSGFLSFELDRLIPRSRGILIMGNTAIQAIFGDQFGSIIKCLGYTGTMRGKRFVIANHPGTVIQSDDLYLVTRQILKEFADEITEAPGTNCA